MCGYSEVSPNKQLKMSNLDYQVYSICYELILFSSVNKLPRWSAYYFYDVCWNDTQHIRACYPAAFRFGKISEPLMSP